MRCELFPKRKSPKKSAKSQVQLVKFSRKKVVQKSSHKGIIVAIRAQNCTNCDKLQGMVTGKANTALSFTQLNLLS